MTAIIIASTIVLALLIFAPTVVIISKAYLRARRRNRSYTLEHTADGAGHPADDGGEKRKDDDGRVAIPTHEHRHTWFTVIQAVRQAMRTRKLFHYFLDQFVLPFRIHRQQFRNVQLDLLAESVLQGVRARNELQGAQLSLDRTSHSPSSEYPMRYVEGSEPRYLRLTEEEDPNSAPESASGTDQDCEVVVQY